MSELIKKFREKLADRDPNELCDLYYEYLHIIQEAKHEKNFKKLIQYSMISLPLIESVIKWFKDEFGNFGLEGIPAIDYSIPHYATLGYKGHLLNMKEIVDYFPELEPWRKKVNTGIIMCDISKKIKKYVNANPDSLQKDLKKKLNCNEGRIIGNACYYLELHRIIKRVKYEKTYKLSIPQCSWTK